MARKCVHTAYGTEMCTLEKILYDHKSALRSQTANGGVTVIHFSDPTHANQNLKTQVMCRETNI